MELADHLQALRAGVDTFFDASTGDLDRPVPSCPGWTVADLVGHIGLVWGWAAANVRTGVRSDRPEPPSADPAPVLLGWARARSEEVVDAIARFGVTDPDQDCWTFGPPRTRRFWVRRMAQETAVHAWDAQTADGVPVPIEGELAADGVDEFLTVMIPRYLQRNPDSWSGQTVHLHRSDGPGEWTVRLDPNDTVIERGHAKADVAVRGPASSLYLWCVGRGRLEDLGDLEVFGDPSVADKWSTDVHF